MNVYTDPRLLDVAGAMDALPALPLGVDPISASAVLKATGTDDSAARQFAPGFAPTIGNWCKPGSIRDKQARWEDPRPEGQKTGKTPVFPGVFQAEGTGLEPATPCGAPHFQCGR